MPEDQLAGDEGQVFGWRFDNSQKEADYLAGLIATWVREELVPLSEIAVLVSKQLDLYADRLMAALDARKIPYRNEQELQDLTAEPAARLVVDYLACLYGQREPKAWKRLTTQLTPFAGEEVQSGARQDLMDVLKQQRVKVAAASLRGEPYADWWASAQEFLDHVGRETLAALSSDYESEERLKDVLVDTKQRIEDLLGIEPDLPIALQRLSDDQAVRILTIHKSKGLEFDSVIMMAVEKEIFFGDQDANRCAFFVGVSRAKRRLVLTHADYRERPASHTKRWDAVRSAQSEYFGYVMPFVNS